MTLIKSATRTFQDAMGHVFPAGFPAESELFAGGSHDSKVLHSRPLPSPVVSVANDPFKKQKQVDKDLIAHLMEKVSEEAEHEGAERLEGAAARPCEARADAAADPRGVVVVVVVARVVVVVVARVDVHRQRGRAHFVSSSLPRRRRERWREKLPSPSTVKKIGFTFHISPVWIDR